MKKAFLFLIATIIPGINILGMFILLMTDSKTGRFNLPKIKIPNIYKKFFNIQQL
jgi:hypothetical protein